MKFTSVIISFVFYAFLSSALLQALNGILMIEKRRDFFRKEALSTRFISESFRKTCNEKGFENLSEWKDCCKALWKLDYITFREEEKVLCGVWIYESKRYEVYYRKKEDGVSRWM